MNACIIKLGRNSVDLAEFLPEDFETISENINETVSFIKDNLYGLVVNDDFVLNINDIKHMLSAYIQNYSITDNAKSNISYILNNIEKLLSFKKYRVIEDLSARIDTTDKIIPVISQDLNDYLRKEINTLLFETLVYNDSDGVKLPGQLSASLIDFKNLLFHKVCEYIGASIIDVQLDSIDVDEFAFSACMEEAWKKISSQYSETRPFQAALNPTTLKELDYIKAFYILNNFDEFLSKFSHNIIEIKENKIGTHEISSDKYRIIDQHKTNSSYAGDHVDQDADKQFGKLFYAFWNSISDGKQGRLSKYDFNKFTNFVLLSINELRGTWDFLYDETLSDKEFKDKLLLAIENDTVLHARMGQNGETMCKHIAAKLKKFWDNYQSVMNDPYISLKDKALFELKFNFILQFTLEVKGHHNNTFLSVDDNGNTKITSAARITMSKESVKHKLRESLKKNLSNWDFRVYHPLLSVDREANYLYGVDFLNFMKELTGLSFSKETLDRFFVETPDGDSEVGKLFTFIDEFTFNVATRLIPKVRNNEDIDKLVDDFIEDMSMHAGWYIDFSSKYISDNRNDVLKLFDQQGNPQPLASNPNTVRLVCKNINDFRKQYGGNNENILSKHPLLIQGADSVSISSNKFTEHIAQRLDVKVGDRVIKAVELSPLDTLIVAFNNEFFDSCIAQGTFYNQIECYSDKPTIALAAYNMMASIIDPDYSGTLLEAPADLVKKLYIKLHNAYYKKVGELITRDLNVLFKMHGTLEEVIAKLETYTVEDFKKLVEEYNADFHNPHIDILLELHYSNQGGKCVFNNTLYFNIKGKGLTDYYELGYKDFKQDFQFVRIPEKFLKSGYVENNIKRLAALFNLDISNDLKLDAAIKQLEAFFSNEYWMNDDPLSETLMQKYYALLALFTEADLQITSKSNDIHTPKKVKLLPISTASTDWDTFYKNVLIDQSERLKVLKKRNNSLVASSLPMSVTTKYGVSRRAKIAVVEAESIPLMNYNGQTNDQDPHDGALWTLGIAAFWENRSWPGKTVDMVKKVIGLVPTLMSMQQYKCADYPIDNLLLNMAFSNNSILASKMLLRAKKMMEPGVFDYKFKEAFLDYSIESGVPIYKRFGDEVYGLNSIQWDSKTDTWTLSWSSTEDGEIIVNPPVLIDNVYQLWEALGSYNTIEEKDGTWVPSNSSMELISLLISEFNPEVKERVVSKLIGIGSNKSGITNVNRLEDIEREDLPLNHTFIDNSRWGMQQDYSHESDESHIPSLTQVISAIAFNGKNIKLVLGMYDTLAELTLLQAKDRNVKYNNIDFHKKLVKELMHSLEGTNSRSDALRKVTLAYKAMVNGNKEARVAYSSPDIFYKLASDFITTLNKRSIRQTFSGIAIIQNPSHSIIGLYEDNKGKTYTRQGLIKLGIEKLQKLNLSREEKQKYSDDNLVDLALQDERFADGEFVQSANELELEDTVRLDNVTKTIVSDDSKLEIDKLLINGAIVYLNGNQISSSSELALGDEVTISNFTKRIEWAEDLFDIKDYLSRGATVLKVHKYQRNLKPPVLRFKLSAEGKEQNFWLTEAVRLRREAEKMPDGLEKLTRLKEIMLFYRANLAGLSSPSPFIYLTLDAFKESQRWESNRKDRYNSALPAERESIQQEINPYKTKVFDVKFLAGELIIPKVNMSRQMLGDYTLEDIEDLGPKYFKGLVAKKYSKVNHLLLEDNMLWLVTAVRDEDEIIYTDRQPANDAFRPNPENIKEIDGQLYYVNEYNEKLFPVPSRDIRILQSEVSGKLTYIVYSSKEELDKNLFTTVFNIDGLNALYEEPASMSKGLPNYKLNKALNILNEINTTGNIDKEFDRVANEIFNSFKLSNYTVSARIPSQSFQSFMANKTVAFTLDNMNNGYVNLHEVWFTGSDYDIKYY